MITSEQALRNQLSNSRVRILVLFVCLVAVIFLLSSTPLIFIPILLSMTLFFILTPLVNFMERSGYSRGVSAFMACCIFFLPTYFFAVIGTTEISIEIAELRSLVPVYIEKAKVLFLSIENNLRSRFSFLEEINITKELIGWLSTFGGVFLSKSPQFISTLLWSVFLVPLLTHFMLKDGRGMTKGILMLTPNRYFESTYSVMNQVTKKLGRYILAKLFEAIIVGFLIFLGLWILGFPHALLIGLFAGITNIIPYLGPVIGVVPAILIALFDPQAAGMLPAILILFLAVNVLDIAIIFPVLVSKVIDLHPLLVLLSVLLGGHYGGPIGLLIAIPIAAIIKTVTNEVLEISSAGPTSSSS